MVDRFGVQPLEELDDPEDEPLPEELGAPDDEPLLEGAMLEEEELCAPELEADGDDAATVIQTLVKMFEQKFENREPSAS